MTDDIKLPTLKVGNLPTVNRDEYPGLGDWWVQLRFGPTNDDVFARVYGDSPDQAKARAKAVAAVLADREKDGVTLEGCLETLFKIGEHLGLDYSASRSAEGKPSDVYIKAIEAKVSAAVLADRERMKGKVDALRLDAERYRWLRNNANSDEDGLCAVRIERWSYGEAMLDLLVRHELDEAIDAARAAGGE